MVVRSIPDIARYLEHATIPPYLTALLTLSGTSDSVAFAQEEIMNVLMEEMMHMGLACNRHRQVIWECLWRSRCEWTGWQKIVADCVFQAAAAVMIWFQTAERLVISVRHSGALIR